jgi:hypothetical protein
VKDKFNRVLYKYLNNVEFCCKTCAQKFIYEGRKDHIEECLGNFSITCPLNCGELFFKEQELSTHLTQHCTQVYFTCEACNSTNIPPTSKERHVCEGEEFTCRLIEAL